MNRSHNTIYSAPIITGDSIELAVASNVTEKVSGLVREVVVFGVLLLIRQAVHQRLYWGDL
jgi:hypothetical protein